MLAFMLWTTLIYVSVRITCVMIDVGLRVFVAYHKHRVTVARRAYEVALQERQNALGN